MKHLTTLLIAVVCLVSTEAKAHPLLDDGIVSYEEAEFRGALRAFNLAARDADLSMEELLLLFEMRALVYHAMGNRTAMLMDLKRLGALRPTHELSGLAPPPVRQLFDKMLEARGGSLGVELVLEEKSFEGKPFVVARVEQVPKGLVHHLNLQCRIPPDGRTIARTVQGNRARMPLSEAGAHEGCTAAAETRRGTVLFSASIEGTPAPPPLPEPEVVPPPSANVFQMPRYEGQQVDEPVAKKKKWPWIVAVSVVAVAGGVTAGVLLSQRSDSGSNQSTSNGVTVSW